jgi:hypothetical protein
MRSATDNVKIMLLWQYVLAPLRIVRGCEDNITRRVNSVVTGGISHLAV